jgi:hypothetical protein
MCIVVFTSGTGLSMRELPKLLSHGRTKRPHEVNWQCCKIFWRCSLRKHVPNCFVLTKWMKRNHTYFHVLNYNTDCHFVHTVVLISPSPTECENPLGKFLPRFFGIKKTASSSLLSSKGPNYQRGVLLISPGLVAVACFLPGRAKVLSAPL